MKTCSTSLRQNAYKVYLGHESLEKDKVVLEKFFKYIDAYCAEMKCTELDIFLNDENWENVYQLFDNVMMKRNEYDKVIS
jgi:hypothetical protein